MSWFDRRCFSHSSPQGQYFQLLVAHPTKERSRAPTHRIIGPFVAPLSDSEKREKTPNTAQYHKKQ
jgi:hypothetical protein